MSEGRDLRPRPVASVVIPCKNSAATVGEQLGALAAQRDAPPFEVLIVDNGSTDATIQVVERYRTSLDLAVVSAADLPVAAAIERGVARSQGEFILFLDSDDVIAPDYLRMMTGGLQEHRAVAARLDPVPLNPGYLADIRPLAQAQGLVPWRGFHHWAQGCGLAVRREALVQVGGMPSGDLSSGWDVDLCWQLRTAGIELHFVPEAVVAYRFRHEPAEIWRQATRYGRSSVQRYLRWRERGMPRSSVPIQLLRWVALLVRVPLLIDKKQRRRWCFDAGLLFARLVESLRCRVLYL